MAREDRSALHLIATVVGLVLTVKLLPGWMVMFTLLVMVFPADSSGKDSHMYTGRLETMAQEVNKQEDYWHAWVDPRLP